MAASGILKEYLIRLGFRVEATSERQFLGSIDKSTVKVVEMGAAVEATAALVVAGFAKMAESMEKLFFVARNADATVSGIKSLGYALTQLGGSAEATTTAIESFGKFLQGSPGAIGLVRSLGIQTNDANGNLRDTAAIMGDLGKRLREMPTYRAQAYAGVFGIDYHTLMAMRQGTEEFSNQYQGWLRAAGVDTDKAAAASHGFMVQLRGLLAVFGILEQKIILALGPGMGRTVENFRNLVMRNMGPITHIISALASGIVGAGEILIRFFERATEAFQSLSPAGQRVVEALGAILVAWRVLSIGFLASPLGIVLAGLTALLLLFDDFQTYKEGGKTLIDWGALFKEIEPLQARFKEFRDYLVSIWPDIRDAAKATWKEIKADLVDIKEYFTGVWEGAQANLKPFKDQLGDLKNSLKDLKSAFDELSKSQEDTATSDKKAGGKLFGQFLIKETTSDLKMVVDFIHTISHLLKGEWAEAWNSAAEVMHDMFSDFDGVVANMRKTSPKLATLLFGDPLDLLKNNADATPETPGLVAPGSGATGGYSAGNPGPSINFDDVVQFFMKKGLPMKKAIGIASNFDVESAGMHPYIWGDNGQAFGLAQMHPERRAAVEAHFKKRMEDMSPTEQLEGLYWDMFQNPKEAATGQALLNAPNDERTAAEIVTRGFERPKDVEGQVRLRRAHASQRSAQLFGAHWTQPNAMIESMKEQALRATAVNPFAGPRVDLLNRLTVPPPLIDNPSDGSVPVSINQTNNFNVSGVSNPNSAAEEVLRGQKRVTADLARNTAGAVR